MRGGLRACAFGCVVIGVSAGLTSCVSNGPTPRAAAVQHPVLENFPLPQGFSLVDDKSRGMSTGRLRWAQCVFEGNSDRTSCVRFFEEYLPPTGWEERERRFENGVYELRFSSEKEECEIRIKADKLRKTNIEIDLRQKPDGSVDRTEDTPPPRNPKRARPKEQ